MARNRKITDYISLNDTMIQLNLDLNEAKTQEERRDVMLTINDTLVVMMNCNSFDVIKAAWDLNLIVTRILETETVEETFEFRTGLINLMAILNQAARFQRMYRNINLKRSITELSEIIPMLLKGTRVKEYENKRIYTKAAEIAEKLGFVVKNESDKPSTQSYLDFIAKKIVDCEDDKLTLEVREWLISISKMECVTRVLNFVKHLSDKNQ